MTEHVTIRTVARLAGTSPSTVSAAFNPGSRISKETRDRVIAAADQLNWRPDRRASALRSNTQTVIGMIYEVNRPFQSHLVDSVYAAAAAKNMELVLAGATPRHSELACVRLLLGERCRALMVTGTSLPPNLLEEVARLVPTLTLARSVDAPGVNAVYSDANIGEQLAVEHLVELGHERIAHLAGSGRSMSSEREEGYREAMTKLGLASNIQVIPCGNDFDNGVYCAGTLAHLENRPTAVTCYNDAVGAGLILRLGQLGISVPQDLSVVGYNDLDIASSPLVNLTTVRQDPEILAKDAIAILAKKISSPRDDGEVRVAVASTLIVRGSTGPAR